MPIRDDRFNHTQPVDGSDPATDWQGMHSLESIPHVTRPPNGWVYNTNNCRGRAAATTAPVPRPTRAIQHWLGERAGAERDPAPLAPVPWVRRSAQPE